MFNISIIGEEKTWHKNKDVFASAMTEYRCRFVAKTDLVKTILADDLAVIILAWDGFRETLNQVQLAEKLEQRALIVMGPAHYFFEVEDLVLSGSATFVVEPVSAGQMHSLVKETLRLRERVIDKIDKKEMTAV